MISFEKLSKFHIYRTPIIQNNFHFTTPIGNTDIFLKKKENIDIHHTNSGLTVYEL